MIKFEQHIPVTNNDQSVIELLHAHCEPYALSINQIKSAIVKGALWITRGKTTQRLRKIKKTLHKDDELHFYFDHHVLNQTPPQALLIADKNSYSVWYKPYGMLSQGSKWSDHCTITRWAETHMEPQRPAFIVHRLDRAASGLIIVAHSKKIAKAFSQLFEHRQLDKIYHIVVHGELPIDKYQHTGKVITQDVNEKSAKSTFFPIDYDIASDLTLIKVKIDSGRKHQIRQHAVNIKHPVVGDRLYGDDTQQYGDNINLQLCAVQLSFCCPVTQSPINIKLPNDLMPQLDTLGQQLSQHTN